MAIPVGLVTPLPLALGTTDCPVPVPIPIPVPFPLFFVVNDDKFQDYQEYLDKLKDILATSEEDLELLNEAQTLFPNDDLLGLAKFNPKVREGYRQMFDGHCPRSRPSRESCG